MKHALKTKQSTAKRARRKLFLRAFSASLLIFACMACGLLGIAQADRSSRTVGFADAQPAIAVDYHDGRLYVRFFDYEAEWDVGKPLLPRKIWMQPVGQASAHAPQPVHLVGSTEATKSVTVTAPSGQTLVHFMQPIQPAVHFLRVTPPLS